MNEYGALIEEAGAASSALEGYDFDGTVAGSAAGIINSLVDAVEALTAESDITSVLEEKWRHTALAAMTERDALRAQLDGMTTDRDSWKRLWERLDSTSEKHYENLIQDRIDAETAAGDLERAAATIWSEGYVVGWGAGRNGQHRAGDNPYRKVEVE